MYVYKIAFAVLSFLNKKLAAAADAQIALAEKAEAAAEKLERETHEKIVKLEMEMHEKVMDFEDKMDQYEHDARKAKALSDKIAALVE